LIAATSSTKNKVRTRDPEMRQAKKGNQWYFWIKLNAGVDNDSSLIHSVVVMVATIHDLTQGGATAR
jgi:IS5 family transposase